MIWFLERKSILPIASNSYILDFHIPYIFAVIMEALDTHGAGGRVQTQGVFPITFLMRYLS